MIINHAQAQIHEVNGPRILLLNVNFDEENKDCVKVTFDTHDIVVKYSDLFSFMFTLATKEQQAKMIPVREELGTQYMKQISVKLTKDLKAGEFMTVNVPINVPEIVAAGNLKEDIKTPYLTNE